MTFVLLNIIPYRVLPAHTGGQRHVVMFNEYLGRHMKIVAVGTKNNKAHLANRFTLHPVFSNSRLRYANPFLFFTLSRMIRRLRPNALMIEHPYFGWLAWLLARRYHLPWVVHSHNIEYMRSRSIGRRWWKALKWYERWVYRSSSMVFFISDEDRAHATNVLKVSAEKAFTIPYGVEADAIPTDLEMARVLVKEKHGIGNEKILLFNGALYLKSNYDAVRVIIDEINPLLMASSLAYKIIICGKGLPGSFDELRGYADRNIIFAGFVEDVSLYFKAADIFLNPVMSGGGVKTKVIEALAANCTVVSTETGAVGVNKKVCGNKLTSVTDKAWSLFAKEVIAAASERRNVPPTFFEYYNLERLAYNASTLIKSDA